VYNEERTLERVAEALVATLPESEIVYVNDGSKDRSLEILKRVARPQDKVITKENGGKGSAIRLGLQHTSAPLVVIQDADLEYDPADIVRLLDFAEKHPGIGVYGSRFLEKNPNIYPLYLLGNKVLTWWINLLFGAKLTDSYTCLKLLPREIFQSLPLKANGFELETELCAYPLLAGIRIEELPVSYRPRTFEEGKKICWKDAVRGALTALKIRWNGRRKLESAAARKSA
jgi:glycosyltransferase involved in cell wall biosynthesis